MTLALVTGASRGIGAEVARGLAGTHSLLLGGRDAAALAALAAELPHARPWPVELTSVSAADVAGIDRLDVLVHSAGVARFGPLESVPADLWRSMYEVNVVAVAELTRLLLPALRAAGGRVVLINSGAGRVGNAGWGPYAASKFALRAYADILRAEEPSLRVTTVFPGSTATDMQRTVQADQGGEYDPAKYLDAATVAASVLHAVRAPADAHITEVVVRPRG